MTDKTINPVDYREAASNAIAAAECVSKSIAIITRDLLAENARLQRLYDDSCRTIAKMAEAMHAAKETPL